MDDRRLVIAISSRALFDLDESHTIFENEGKDAYCRYQIEHENDVLKPGFGFSLVNKLLGINKAFDGSPLVEVILLSQNSSDTGLRIFNSIRHYELDIRRAVFTSGRSPFEYIPAFGAHLFLSANGQDVRNSLNAGYAAATIITGATAQPSDQLRIAFDGDSVLFSDESEQVFRELGLAGFISNESDNAHNPLPDGPMKGFLSALHSIQTLFDEVRSPIRTALVTARAAPAHERVVRTLREWGIRIDESAFLGGMPKGPFLRAFGADIFFDDQAHHCSSAITHQIPAAHVPNGILNEEK